MKRRQRQREGFALEGIRTPADGANGGDHAPAAAEQRIRERHQPRIGRRGPANAS